MPPEKRAERGPLDDTRFVLKEIGPSIYNAAITDAQVYFRERVADLEGACFEPEFGYWPRETGRRSSR